MSRRYVVRITTIALAAGALLGTTASTAWAWPIPFTAEQQNFINQARSAGYPGSDDDILQAFSFLR
ncbi:hypothetical protein QRB41_26935 [Mycobacterium avium subsp. hominissuis]|jgi:hypothetical protein|uniref:hypothetical protein n=1 Tax=Mycobacterium TaxID=1763 RepID=UPI001140DB1A|nr:MULTISPECIES: hypothetical protein [Mycobacterium]MCQ4363441.1 hypothetical protein [Mycobacterium gordonae]MDO2386953.1 hypothetical protein [Mycobacterium avium subsp. hominissuis]MDO2397426.1 hypothetical protein [Mycobacterium avium subsp. hominissuis]